MGTTYVTITIEAITCGACGIPFGIEEAHLRMLRQTGKGFNCPSGCGISYGKSENQKLKSELEQEQARLARERERRLSAEKESEYFRKSRDGMKGALVKAKKRAVAGVCPCCTRTFQNVARHMASKHPEATKESHAQD